YKQAIKLDPDFALAHAGVGRVCALIYEWREQKPEWIERGIAACERALAVDPDLAEVLAARARMFYAEENFEKSIAYAQKALERKPDCEGAYDTLLRSLFASDQFAVVHKLMDAALEANGDDYNVYIPLLNAMGRLGDQEALHKLRQRQSQALLHQLDLVPEDVRARILLASNHADEGRASDAIRQLETAVALAPSDSSVLYNAACTYAVLGRKTEAIEMIRKTMIASYRRLELFTRDPDLAIIQEDPEFKRILAQHAHSY
ncbi:MAG: TPR end-of-group domain-containing protein, partial [Candidatus Acidiferrum sp.]